MCHFVTQVGLHLRFYSLSCPALRDPVGQGAPNNLGLADPVIFFQDNLKIKDAFFLSKLYTFLLCFHCR